MTRLESESRLLGCLLGGAVGDALGEPVEFMTIDQIHKIVGPEGVTGYPTHSPHPGAFTDDTQMTLWTAEGLIRARQRQQQSGIWDPVPAINGAYLRWLLTQRSGAIPTGIEPEDEPVTSGRLIEERGLWVRMAPGSTCLSALRMGGGGTREDPINDSKGCGGVMRAAPAGLIGLDDEAVYRLGCDLAALTHGHPAGYITSGALALIVNRLWRGDSPRSAVDAAVAAVESDEPGGKICADLLLRATDLAESETPSYRVVERLGAGWVAEEALAISVYCALVARDFRTGVLLAVNHSGDSDSTGSICGQIMGTALGLEAIPDEWLDGLRLRGVVDRVATDLYQSFHEGHVFSKEVYPPW